MIGQIIGQVFRHPLGERRYDAFALIRAPISDGRSSTWVAAGANLDQGIDQPGRAHHLLDHLSRCVRSYSAGVADTKRCASSCPRTRRTAAAGYPAPTAGRP
jgi:hypothetical protein